MDLFNNVLPVQLLAAQTINNTDTNSSILDIQGFARKGIFVALGDLTGVDADSTLELFLEEANDTAGANFTAVAVAEMVRSTTGLSSASTAGLFGTINATTEDVINYRVEYLGMKRYVRARLDFTTGTGGITAAPVTVTGLLSAAAHAPAAAPAPVTAT